MVDSSQAFKEPELMKAVFRMLGKSLTSTDGIAIYLYADTHSKLVGGSKADLEKLNSNNLLD